MSTMTFPDGLHRVATGQLGSFSRQQAHAAGVSDHELRRWVQSGALLQIGPHSFRGVFVPATPLADLIALVLDVGRPCWASGPTAAALHGFDGFRLRPPYHLVTATDRNVRRAPHVIRRKAELPLIDIATLDQLPVLRPARTLIELAALRETTDDQLLAAFDSGLRDGKFNETLLHRRIAALRGPGSVGPTRLLRVIERHELTAGGHSWLERRFLQLVHAAGLPRPDTQVVVTRRRPARLVRVDFRFPDTPVIVEVLGYRFHRTADDLRRDAERLNALLLAGNEPYQFTYRHIVDDPNDALSTVANALRRHLPRLMLRPDASLLEGSSQS